MQVACARITTALKVLHALALDGQPVPLEDAAALLSLAESDEERAMNLDDLACVIIERERKRLVDKLARAHSASGY